MIGTTNSISDAHLARRQALRANLAGRQDIDALLVTYAANRFYLSGFELFDSQCNESSGCLIIHADGREWLLTDSRYELEAQRVWSPDSVYIYRTRTKAEIARFVAAQGVKRLGIEADSLCVEMYEALRAECEVVLVTGLVEAIRVRKDEYEIRALRAACDLNHKVMAQAEALMVPGMSEFELAWAVERLYREQGAQRLSFSTIAAVGPNGAKPHAIPGDAAITDGCPVLLDMGCRLNNYCSDQTRTFWVGDRPDPRFLETRARVLEAQAEALKQYGPGLSLAEAFQTARAVFDRYGVAEHFTHSLGHGIGLETHEAPSVGPNSKGTFEPGMVVTCEPGLYYPEWGGVRWEYMALITETGVEVF
ncbi:MAG: aminopeptidase P family protein [Deltaproteobacteria bacterium]|nr:aminopeptidase P family protein [Deltaproteobacteria bacterium]